MNDNLVDFEIYGVIGYTTMCNYHFRDERLSWKAKGILSTILSLPKDWKYSIEGLIKLAPNGRDSLRSGLEELKKAEYLKIDKYRDEKGIFRYKYRIYYLPYPIWQKMTNLTRYGNSYLDKEPPDTDFPVLDNPTLLNNNNKKDKIDKTPVIQTGEEIKHNIITNELIRRNYISEYDNSSFLFDQLFEDLLKQGNNYKDLLIMTNYIISRVKGRKFKDEDGNEITNKFGYLKNALNSNINKFNNMPDSLYENFDERFS